MKHAEAVAAVINHGVRPDQIQTEEWDGLPYFTPDNPMYPHIRIQLFSAAGSMFAMRRAVTDSLRRTVGPNAADWFAREAAEHEGHDELLEFVRSTVRVL